MVISSFDLKRCTLVRLCGRIDGPAASELEKFFAKLHEAGKHEVVINMGGVGYTCEEAVQALINFQKLCRGLRGCVCLVEISAAVREVLDLRGLTSVTAPGGFGGYIFDLEAKAVDSFN